MWVTLTIPYLVESIASFWPLHLPQTFLPWFRQSVSQLCSIFIPQNRITSTNLSILLWKYTFNYWNNLHLTSICGEGNGNPLQYSAWRIPGTEEPGGLPSMGSHSVGHDWLNLAAAAASVWWFPLHHYFSFLTATVIVLSSFISLVVEAPSLHHSSTLSGHPVPSYHYQISLLIDYLLPLFPSIFIFLLNQLELHGS